MYYTEQVLLEAAKKFDTSTSSIKTNHILRLKQGLTPLKVRLNIRSLLLLLLSIDLKVYMIQFLLQESSLERMMWMHCLSAWTSLKMLQQVPY